MKYEDYVRNFKGRIIDLVEEYIKCHTEIDYDDGILIDYRTHIVEGVNRKNIKGRRGDFYSMRSLVSEESGRLVPQMDIIDDAVSMYV
jgi:hypothetical protein